MTSDAVSVESESGGLTGAVRLRAEIERNHVPLLWRIGGLLLAAEPGLGRAAALARAEEVFSETVQRALERADHYDPARASVVTWLMAIATRVLAGQRRELARPRRKVPGSVLGDAVWERLLG
jgi:hypothetical protein